MKKILALAIISSLVLVVSGCNSSSENKNDKAETTTIAVEETFETEEATSEETELTEIYPEEKTETETQEEFSESNKTATKQYAEKEGSDEGKGQITESDAIKLASENYGFSGQEDKMYISSQVYIRNMPYYAVNVTGVSGTDKENITHIFVSQDGSAVFAGYIEDDGSAVILG